MKILGFGKSQLPQIHKDPFKKTCVTNISVHYSCGYDNKWDARGYVDFKNGNTTGKQKFEGETFDDVVMLIKSFIETLD